MYSRRFPNPVIRAAGRSAILFLVIIVVPSLPGCSDDAAKTGGIKAETPQALVSDYNRAVTKKDWRLCFLCCDPKMQGDFLIRLFYAAGVSRDAELAAIIKRHLIHEIPMPDSRRNSRESKELLAYETIQKQVDDLPRFVDEMCRRLDAVGQGAFTQFGEVRDITILEDKAIGYWTPPVVKSAGAVKSKVGTAVDDQGQSLSNNREPIQFCKMGGKWYITITDRPPPLSVSERAKLLKAEVESLFVYLCCSTGAGGSADEPNQANTTQPLSENRYGELRLTVRPYGYVRLTEAQAKKLIDYLAAEGYLGQAVELGKQDVPERDLSQNCYALQVSTQSLQLHEDLGWGPGMLKRLEGLRGALDGEAAKAMDALLAKLAEDRKEWEDKSAQPQHQHGAVAKPLRGQLR